MKIKEISFAKGVKYSANYNSRDIHISATATLDESEDEETAMLELKRFVQREINEHLSHYGISTELKDFYQAREVVEPSQNWQGIDKKF